MFTIIKLAVHKKMLTKTKYFLQVTLIPSISTVYGTKDGDFIKEFYKTKMA
jgi:hypothetical protein